MWLVSPAIGKKRVFSGSSITRMVFHSSREKYRYFWMQGWACSCMDPWVFSLLWRRVQRRGILTLCRQCEVFFQIESLSSLLAMASSMCSNNCLILCNPRPSTLLGAYSTSSLTILDFVLPSWFLPLIYFYILWSKESHTFLLGVGNIDSMWPFLINIMIFMNPVICDLPNLSQAFIKICDHVT